MTQRYFSAEPLLESGQQVRLDSDESHHLLRVMRGEPGRQVQLIGNGRLFSAELLVPDGKTAVLRLLEELQAPLPAPVEMTFALPWIKGGNTEWAIQKLTELGADAFIIFSARREVAQGKSDKINKFTRVIIETCKQCGRPDIPSISAAKDLRDLCSATEYPREHRLLLYEEERENLFSDAVKAALICGNPPARPRLLIISGPEGGFDAAELAEVSSFLIPTTLGPRILRAETAPIAAAAAILAHSGAL